LFDFALHHNALSAPVTQNECKVTTFFWFDNQFRPFISKIWAYFNFFKKKIRICFFFSWKIRYFAFNICECGYIKRIQIKK